MEWYYVIGGERAGPVSQGQFDQLLQAGVITQGTLVWRAGMTEWQTWAQVSAALTAGGDSAVCAVSGRIFPKSGMLEYEGRWVSAEHKDVFFQRLREGLPAAAGGAAMRYAGFWIRFAAYIIDYICLNVIAVVLMFLVGVIIGIVAQGNPNVRFVIQLAAWVLAIVIGLVYNMLFLRAYDATPGKLALGLKVLRANGEKLSAGRIAGRYFSKGASYCIVCIGFMMAGWDSEKRALHDMMCDTRVVYK